MILSNSTAYIYHSAYSLIAVCFKTIPVSQGRVLSIVCEISFNQIVEFVDSIGQHSGLQSTF